MSSTNTRGSRMSFNEYIPLAVRTLNNLGSRKKNLAHMGLGIGTEIMEYELIKLGDKSDTIVAELGDLSWFTASTMKLLNIKYVFNKYEEVRNIITYRTFIETAYKIADNIKKHFAYGIPILDRDKLLDRIYAKWLDHRGKKYIKIEALDYQLHIMVACIRHFASINQIEFDHVLISNIEKLKKRYPKGYSDYHASERFDKK